MVHTQPAGPAAAPGAGRPRVRRMRASWLRLASGLVLFGFVLTHLLNHALGLISVDAMLAVQEWRTAITRSLPGTALLIGSAVIHMLLGLARLTGLHSWRIGLSGLLQLGFGLLIPILMVRHVLGTRGVHSLFGIEDDYTYALWAIWPGEALNMAILIVLVWVHGCIGLHYWLDRRAWYRRFLWLWQGLALLIPVLAYSGFVSAGRLVHLQGGYVSPFKPGQYEEITGLMLTSQKVYYGMLAASVLIWLLLLLANRLGSRVTVTYANGPTVQAPRGLSLLAISRINRVPHASVCGGRARCSTCRVRVLAGQDQLNPPSEQEQRVLRRVGAPANVRLACQIFPTANLTVSTLLPARVDAQRDQGGDKYLWGVEQDVTVMFCDLRGFTRMAEGRLSYDVVFLLNQFLGCMADTIEETGGFVDKFMGDGVMAIFGIDKPRDEGARQALAAARAMGGVLDALNQSLREALPAPLSMGIGIHSGAAILGRIGAVRQSEAGTARLTALGETVNLASRLEGMTRDLGVQLALSAVTVEWAGLPPAPGLDAQEVDVRGLSHPIAIFAVKRAADLPQPSDGPTPQGAAAPETAIAAAG